MAKLGTRIVNDSISLAAQMIAKMSLLALGSEAAGDYAGASIEHITKGIAMVRVALWVRLDAKPGQEAALKSFLESGLALANQEEFTPVWFALRLSPSTFGIFDAFADDSGRKAHLAGKIAAALMAKAPELLAQPPKIEQVDVLAAKLPG
jgi:quinol monooxygenase YgiN